jgi:FAD-dependent urate hydroxylase
MQDGQVVATIGDTRHRLDFVIAGTGYSADLASRPELRDVASQVLLWRDVYTPVPAEQDERLGCQPYLGAGHELKPRTPHASSLLKDIHVQNPAGFVSFGLPIGDVPSMKRDIPVIVGRISADLFLGNLAVLRERMTGSVPQDFSDALYRAAVRRP